MKKSITFIFILLFLFTCNSYTQDLNLPKAKDYDVTALGIGAGLDYGGYGLNLMHYSKRKALGFFAGIGYIPTGVGFDAGIKYRLFEPNAQVNPYLDAMFGNTCSIVVSNASQFNKTFYGISVGAGFDFRFKKISRGFWTLAWNMPVSMKNVQQYMEYLRTVYYVQSSSDPARFVITVGYHYFLN